MVGLLPFIGNDKNPRFPANTTRADWCFYGTGLRPRRRLLPARFVVFLLKDKDKPALIPAGRH